MHNLCLKGKLRVEKFLSLNKIGHGKQNTDVWNN
jgi:hypothetical protein